MEEQLISFETAKLAKEKGYNITNYLSYDENTGIMLPKDPAYPGWHCYALDGVCPAPTQSLLQKWLREKHNLIVEPRGSAIDKTFSINIFYLGEISTKKSIGYTNAGNTYEEALEDGLQEALKMI